MNYTFKTISTPQLPYKTPSCKVVEIKVRQGILYVSGENGLSDLGGGDVNDESDDWN